MPQLTAPAAPVPTHSQGLHLSAAGGLAALAIMLLVLGALTLALVMADGIGVGPRHELWRRVMRRRLQL